MEDSDRNRRKPSRRWVLTAVRVLLAGAVGFGLAKLISHPPRPDTTPAVPSESAAPIDTLQIPERSLTTMGIALESVAPGNLSAEIQAPATVSAAPNGEAEVTARASGTVVRLNKRLGDQVK